MSATPELLATLRATKAARHAYDKSRGDNAAKVAWTKYQALVNKLHELGVTPHEVDIWVYGGGENA